MIFPAINGWAIFKRNTKLESIVMNVEIIFEVSHATLGGTMPFPDAVGKLMGAGVELF